MTAQAEGKSTVERERLAFLMNREETRFADEHPESRARFERAGKSLLSGVPMNWMVRWAGRFPVFVEEAQGARFRDVDGHEYVDLCLGDTGAMTGHAPTAAVHRISEQAARGITTMLPTDDAIVVGEELQRRFGLPYWQFTLTATDANRFAIRLARMITRRPKVLVFNWCYHGSVDETFATLRNGEVRPRDGNIGPAVDPALTTRVVEFNDLAALERELAAGDVACVLAEPAMTNIGIIHPEPGFHAGLRDLTRRFGSLLLIDETHTWCTGPGGYTGAHVLEPDLFVIGKAIASGIPAGAYGLSEDVARRVVEAMDLELADVGGIGGTLAGNMLSMAAMRVTLTEVMTDSAFGRMARLAEQFEAGVEAVIRDAGVPWHITRLGARAEYLFQPERPRNGSEAAAWTDPALDAFMHLFALNRGILMTPFHNMALMSPATSESDVDRHTDVFRDAVAELFAR